MADCQVTCIRKHNRMSSHEHITHLGNKTTSDWIWPREDVIRSIDHKTNTFYVLDPNNGKRSNVGIVRPTDGRALYLRTYADGDWNDNLLSLPECTAA
jgi:hypothetical protein